MSKVKFISLAVGLVFTTALAQPDGSDEDDEDYSESANDEYDEKVYHKTSAQPSITSSISGSGGYYRVALNDWKDYPFGGFGYAFGSSSLMLITDIAQFGFLASIGYYSVSADEDDVELAISKFYLAVQPKFRLGWEEIYADIFLNVDIPLITEATMKVPGHETSNFDVKDTEANFAVGFFWRFKAIGVGISKALSGNKNTEILAAFFIPVHTRSNSQKSATKIFEISPSISYGTGKGGTNLNISLGMNIHFKKK